MNYDDSAIPDSEVPGASSPIFQHLLRTYASEANKLNCVWQEFAPNDLSFRPHQRSSSIGEIMEHELPTAAGEESAFNLWPNSRRFLGRRRSHPQRHRREQKVI